MSGIPWDDIFRTLVDLLEAHFNAPAPAVSEAARRTRDPFRVLVSTVISLRTKDEVTGAASRRLLARAGTAEALVEMPADEIARLIYPAGFYNTKAAHLKEIARLLLERHDGEVPRDMDALLRLPGVGRKTANLVRNEGYGLPGICVDTHVHRISNRIGWVATKTPAETERALEAILDTRQSSARRFRPARLHSYLAPLLDLSTGRRLHAKGRDEAPLSRGPKRADGENLWIT